jgi:Holliday junction resolvase
MRTHGKVDRNHRAIVAILRQYPGATVHSLASQGGGCPDLILGYRGATILIEVKAKGGQLNALQRNWHAEWTGTPVVVVRSQRDVEVLMERLNHREGAEAHE